jgi:hypothetical protein
MSAIDGFERMETQSVSGLAVLNDEGQLVGNLSASDLRGMGRHEFGDLLMSVEDFTLINKVRLMSMAECLKDPRIAGPSARLLPPSRCHIGLFAADLQREAGTQVC